MSGPSVSSTSGRVGKLDVAAGEATASGNTTCVTPSAGKRLRIFYLTYNPTQAAVVAWRFGATGTLFLRNDLLANSVIAKDLGDLRYLEGAVDQPLILNLSAAVPTYWTVFYQEI